MKIDLVELGQGMQFETNSVTNYIVLRLPTGQLIKAAVTDEEAQDIVQIFVGNKVEPAAVRTEEPRPLPVQRPAPPPIEELPDLSGSFQTGRTPEGDTAMVFGASEVKAPATAPATPTAKRRHRLVGKDSAGNPVVEYEGVNPNEITGSVGVKDEDGVAQL